MENSIKSIVVGSYGLIWLKIKQPKHFYMFYEPFRFISLNHFQSETKRAILRLFCITSFPRTKRRSNRSDVEPRFRNFRILAWHSIPTELCSHHSVDLTFTSLWLAIIYFGAVRVVSAAGH